MQQTETTSDVNLGDRIGIRAAQRPPDTLLALTLRRFRRHKLAMGGFFVVCFMAVVAIFAPLIAPQDPIVVDVTNVYSPPTSAHLLGTDAVGRDVWARLIYASRISLIVGVAAQSVSLTLAVTLGSIAAYFGGRVDDILMRFAEIVMMFPGLILIIIIVSFVGPSFVTVMVVLGLVEWPGLSRLVRSQILSLRQWEFVTAARVIGARDSRIMLTHIFPNIVPVLVVSFTLGAAGAILGEAGLSFLGFGVRPPQPSWGNMLNDARSITAISHYPWVWVPPGIAIFVLVMSINFMGDGLRDALDPRMQLR